MFCMLVTLLEWCDGSRGASAFVSAANPRANPIDNSQDKKTSLFFMSVNLRENQLWF